MCILQHANIVALFAIVFEIGHYGIVMEYVPRGTLEDFVFNYDVWRSVLTCLVLFEYLKAFIVVRCLL